MISIDIHSILNPYINEYETDFSPYHAHDEHGEMKVAWHSIQVDLLHIHHHLQ